MFLYVKLVTGAVVPRPVVTDGIVELSVGNCSPRFIVIVAPSWPRTDGFASVRVWLSDSSRCAMAVGTVMYVSAALTPWLIVFRLNGGGVAGGNVPDVLGGETSGENVIPNPYWLKSRPSCFSRFRSTSRTSTSIITSALGLSFALMIFSITDRTGAVARTVIALVVFDAMMTGRTGGPGVVTICCRICTMSCGSAFER